MSLTKYNQKRDFKITAEPSGKIGHSKSGYSFVIQKHEASHLHYDFRLEFEGVLRSWAIPKGPSSISGVRRLAMEVEDHPLDYGGFEGTIPEGEYGGGTVMLWDQGTWQPLTENKKATQDGFESGKITFALKGKRLRGIWSLVRSGSAENDRVWFLIKKRTELNENQTEITEKELKSVVSKKTMQQIANAKNTRVWHSNRSQSAKKSAAKKPTPKDSVKSLAQRSRIKNSHPSKLTTTQTKVAKPTARKVAPPKIPENVFGLNVSPKTENNETNTPPAKNRNK